MRFPISIDYGEKVLPITDHKPVFALADELNKLNKNNEKYKIEFIKWIQSTEKYGISCIMFLFLFVFLKKKKNHVAISVVFYWSKTNIYTCR